MKTHSSPSKTAAKVAGILACGLFAASSAQAQIAPSAGVPNTIDLKYSTATFGSYLTFTGTNGASSISPLTGSLKFDTRAPATTAPVGSFATYCVELSQYASSNWNTYTLTSFAPNVASSLAHLYQVAGGSPTTLNNSAAFQAAVWEITHETTLGLYSLSNGSFKGSFANNAITTQASTWLDAVNTFSGTELFKAQKYVSATAQDQLVITSVPEPESYAMLLAGLGLMGAIARRRNKQKAA